MKHERQKDSRIQRTKAAIRSAYLRLLGQKSASEITVTDVAQAADVDRKTVYNYYEGAAAILDELENELVALVGKAIKESDFLRCLRDPFGFLQAVTNAFDAHADLSEPLVHGNKQSHVLQKLADACSGRISSLLSDQVQPNQRQYAKLYADFLTNGIVSVYRDWIATDMQQPLEEIAKQISLLLKNGMAAFMA